MAIELKNLIDEACHWRDEKQHAIVLSLHAEPPGAKQRIGVRLDVIAFERFHRRHDELNAGFCFERGKFWVIPPDTAGGMILAESTTRPVRGGRV
jgi:hypothetical protein